VPFWRKGLRRVWNLPLNTHSALLPTLCGLLLLMDELACRCATFISGCLKLKLVLGRYMGKGRKGEGTEREGALEPPSQKSGYGPGSYSH